jgi:ABC-type amino acid transport system permease subunit
MLRLCSKGLGKNVCSIARRRFTRPASKVPLPTTGPLLKTIVSNTTLEPLLKDIGPLTLRQRWNHLTNVERCIFKKDLNTWQKIVCGGAGVIAFGTGVVLSTSGMVFGFIGILKGISYLSRQNSTSDNDNDDKKDSVFYIYLKKITNWTLNTYIDIYNSTPLLVKDVGAITIGTIATLSASNIFIYQVIREYAKTFKWFINNIKGTDNCCNIVRSTAGYSGLTLLFGATITIGCSLTYMTVFYTVKQFNDMHDHIKTGAYTSDNNDPPSEN